MPAQYPNNLENMLGSGGTSIDFTLAQQRNAEAQDQLDQQRQTLANQFSEQANPIKLQQEQANLESTQAQIPGQQAQSRILNTSADIGEATKDSDIKAKLSRDLTSMSTDQITKLGNQGQAMIQMATLAEGGEMPSLEQQQMLPPGLMQKLTTPEGRKWLTEKGTFISTHTAQHLADMEKTRADNAARERVAKYGYDRGVDVQAMKSDTLLKIQLDKAQKAVGEKKFEAASLHFDNLGDSLESQAAQVVDPTTKQNLLTQAASAKQRGAYYANLAKTAPANTNSVSIPTAASGGGIVPVAPPATGAPSLTPGTVPNQAPVELLPGVSVTMHNKK
jgi:hypothetical protein